MNWFKAKKNDTEECIGVDINRNFDYKWMKKATSSDECSDFYGGPYAQSEPEVKLFSNFLTKNDRNVKMFISLNGYGQKIAFSPDGLSPERVDFIRDIALAGTKTLKSFRTGENTKNYTIETRKKKSGTSDQFAMHKANIRYSYSLETRDDENNGFFVPATSIEENAKEILKVISGMVRTLIEY